MNRTSLPLAAPAVAALTLAACAVGPDYAEPELDPVEFVSAGDTPVAEQPFEAAWWSQFGDPVLADLVALQYKRTGGDFSRGTFRVRGDCIDIFPAHYEDRAWRVNLFGDEVDSIDEFDPLIDLSSQRGR